MKEQCKEWSQFFLTVFNTLVLVVLGIDYLKPVHHTFQNFQPHSRVIFDSGTLITAPNANISNGPTEYQPLAIITGYSPVDVAIVMGADKSVQQGYLQSYAINGSTIDLVLNPNGGPVTTKNSVLDDGNGTATFVNVTITNTLTANNAILTTVTITSATATNLTATTLETTHLQTNDATVTGTLTANNISSTYLETVNETVTGTLIAHAATITTATIDYFIATIVNTTTFYGTDIDATNVTVSDTLTAAKADIATLDVSGTLTSQTLNATTINVLGSLATVNATVTNTLNVTDINTATLSATVATITNLNVSSSLLASEATILSGKAIISELVVNGANITHNGGMPSTSYIGVQYYYEIQAVGVTAGDTVTGAWYTRSITTVGTGNLDGIATSLSTNIITLQAGTYYIEASVPADNANGFQARLWDITNNTVLEYGTSAVSSGSQTRSEVNAFVKVANGTTTQFRIEGAYTVNVTGGLGAPANVGGAYEVYTTIKIMQLDQPGFISIPDSFTVQDLVVTGTASIDTLDVTNTATINNLTVSTISTNSFTTGSWDVTGVLTANSASISGALSAQSLTVAGTPITPLQSWVDNLSPGAVYQAQYDLFVTATATTSTNGDACCPNIATDSSDPPTTIRATSYNSIAGYYVPVSSVVRRGDYFKIYDSCGYCAWAYPASIAL